MNEPNQSKDSESQSIENLPIEPTAKPSDGLEQLTTDELQQAEYRRAYLEQLRRMSCPGCGEDPTLPF
jgi:hypothetical protein